jgi:hypothetical protein
VTPYGSTATSPNDPEAKRTFDAAIRSLDGQEAALGQLTAVGERLDGEYASLLVLLQELRTRVAVAKSTDASGRTEGIEQSVKQLNDELSAITQSLLEAKAEGILSPVDETGVAQSTDVKMEAKERM